MLTSIQIEKLRTLTTSQKFGKLVEAAIETWTTKANFIFTRYGLTYVGLDTYKLAKDGKCCLIGAALIDKEKPSDEPLYNGINRIFGLSDQEIGDIWRGFDYYCSIDSSERFVYSEAYLLGYDIRQILLSS